MSTNKMIKEIMRSTSLDKTGYTGITNLGKYTFVIIPVELSKLLLDDDRAPEKYVQGTSAVKLKIAYGTPSELILAKFPKIIVKTKVFTNG